MKLRICVECCISNVRPFMCSWAAPHWACERHRSLYTLKENVISCFSVKVIIMKKQTEIAIFNRSYTPIWLMYANEEWECRKRRTTPVKWDKHSAAVHMKFISYFFFLFFLKLFRFPPGKNARTKNCSKFRKKISKKNLDFIHSFAQIKNERGKKLAVMEIGGTDVDNDSWIADFLCSNVKASAACTRNVPHYFIFQFLWPHLLVDLSLAHNRSVIIIGVNDWRSGKRTRSFTPAAVIHSCGLVNFKHNKKTINIRPNVVSIIYSWWTLPVCLRVNENGKFEIFIYKSKSGMYENHGSLSPTICSKVNDFRGKNEKKKYLKMFASAADATAGAGNENNSIHIRN